MRSIQADDNPTRALARREATILSPLRYPGSKRRFASYVARCLGLNALKPGLFVEPFAGGASVALQLLNDGLVEKIGLSDRDPLIAAFWRTVFFDTRWLLRQVKTMSVTLARWQHWKALKPRTRRQRALKCLFLNRTSFSGIINDTAGPIGGQEQGSEYTVDCRFPRETLARRIEQAADLRKGVAFVWQLDWLAAIHRLDALMRARSVSEDVFLYFDPPFFEKAERLYRFHFAAADHERLRDFLVKTKEPWLLSYDSPTKTADLYSDSGREVQLIYHSTRGVSQRSAREVVLSNLKRHPEQTRLWRTSGEWQTTRGAIAVASANGDAHLEGLKPQRIGTTRGER